MKQRELPCLDLMNATSYVGRASPGLNVWYHHLVSLVEGKSASKEGLIEDLLKIR